VNKQYEEPDYVDVVPGRIDGDRDQLKSEIKTLCFEQPFAVLATLDESQPYTNLISFAVDKELKHLAFSTPSQTKKYHLITKNKNVSLLIDNRGQQPASINLIRALTINGTARPLEDPKEIDYWSGLLIKRHSYLEKFVKSSTSSLILVDITNIIYVRRFQEVYHWGPGHLS